MLQRGPLCGSAWEAGVSRKQEPSGQHSMDVGLEMFLHLYSLSALRRALSLLRLLRCRLKLKTSHMIDTLHPFRFLSVRTLWNDRDTTVPIYSLVCGPDCGQKPLSILACRPPLASLSLVDPFSTVPESIVALLAPIHSAWNRQTILPYR